MTMAECQKCKKQVEGAPKFCPECGERLSLVSKCPKCSVEVAPGVKFCSECGTAIGGVAPTAPNTLAPAVAMDGQQVALRLYRPLQGIYSSYLLERFNTAMRERSVVRRMYILEPGSIEHDVDQALYDMTAAVPKVLNHLGAGNVPLDTTVLYSECKALLGPVNATLSTLRSIMAEAGVAVQTKGSGGVVAGAILGARSKSVWGNLAATGLGAAYDSAEHAGRVQAVASRYNSSAAQLGADFQSTWERVFDKVAATVGTSLRLQLPGTKQVQPAVSEFTDALTQAHAALSSNQVASAIASASRAVAVCSDDPEVLVVRGEARLRNGEPDAALEDAQKVLMLEPTCAEALLLKAEALHAKKGSGASPDTDAQVRQLLQSILSSDADYRILLKAASSFEQVGYADLARGLRNKAATSVPFILLECADGVIHRIERLLGGKVSLLEEHSVADVSQDEGRTMLKRLKQGVDQRQWELNEKHRAMLIAGLGGLRDGEVLLWADVGHVGRSYIVVTTQRVLAHPVVMKMPDVEIALGNIERCAVKKLLLFVYVKVIMRNGTLHNWNNGEQASLEEFSKVMNEAILPAVGKWVDGPATPSPLPKIQAVPPPLPKT